MTDTIIRILFPKEYRVFRHKRLIIIFFRTVHILCFSVLVGGIFFAQDKALLSPWFLGTILSGMGMFLIDMYGSCILLFEVRGVAILVKLLMLALLPFLSQTGQVTLLVIVIILSSYISHTTGKIRHKNLISEEFSKKYGTQ